MFLDLHQKLHQPVTPNTMPAPMDRQYGLVDKSVGLAVREAEGSYPSRDIIVGGVLVQPDN